MQCFGYKDIYNILAHNFKNWEKPKYSDILFIKLILGVSVNILFSIKNNMIDDFIDIGKQCIAHFLKTGYKKEHKVSLNFYNM